MRIGITGTHGVGKTTLTRKLAEYYDLPTIAEVVRVVAKEWSLKHTNDIMALPREELIQFETECYNRQEEYERRFHRRGFITDRTKLDYYVYAHLFGISFSAFGIDPYYTVKNYDVLIYIPPTIPLKADGFRQMDTQMRYEIDDLLVHYLESIVEDNKPFVQVEATEPEARLDEVVDKLKEWGY